MPLGIATRNITTFSQMGFGITTNQPALTQRGMLQKIIKTQRLVQITLSATHALYVLDCLYH